MHHDSDEWAMLLKRMMLDANQWPRIEFFSLFFFYFFYLQLAVSRTNRMEGACESIFIILKKRKNCNKHMLDAIF